MSGGILLSLQRVTKVFGGLKAIENVSFGVERGSIFGLIGPNGAGKTTLFNLITGVYVPDDGSIKLDGDEITRWPPARVAAAGVGRTFQNIRLFRSMTVEQNVMVAGHRIHRAGLIATVFRTRSHDTDEREFAKRSTELLEIMGLREMAKEEAGSLPYGSQRRLEIARALMLSPKLLLLDEPAAGMNSHEADELKRQIRFLRDELKLTIVLVEHNMSVVMGVCERIHVLDHGQTIAEGTPSEVQLDPRVLAAYLGEETPGEAVKSMRESILAGRLSSFGGERDE